jgi:hypothetical protein
MSNNNELLIINLAAVRAGRISNTSSSPSPDVTCHFICSQRFCAAGQNARVKIDFSAVS